MKTKHIEKLLLSNGFLFHRYGEGHAIYKSKDNNRTVSIPIGHKEINRMLARRLIKENKLKAT